MRWLQQQQPRRGFVLARAPATSGPTYRTPDFLSPLRCAGSCFFSSSVGQSSQSNQYGPPVAAKGFTALLNYIFRGHKTPPHFVHISVRKYNGLFPTKFASKKDKAVEVRNIVIGHVTCSGRNQARKSGENCYSFSIPLWFALRHHVL